MSLEVLRARGEPTEEMDLDQLDLNPRITAAVKKGMWYEVDSYHVCFGYNKLQKAPGPVCVPPPPSGGLLFKEGLRSFSFACGLLCLVRNTFCT